MSKKIICNILTSERPVYKGEADLAVVQAYDGKIGFMHNHAPLISELGMGEIRLKDGDLIEYIFVEGGIIEINDNVLTVLAENAIRKQDIDKDEIENELKDLQEQEFEPYSDKQIFIKAKEEILSIKLKIANR